MNRRRLLGNVAKAGGVIAASSLYNPLSIAAPAKQKKIGIALVGLGYYSRDLLGPATFASKYCEVRGIVTGTPSKIPVWQKNYNIPDGNVYNYENMHTIANNPNIDVVYIVLPTFLHKKYSVIAANAGKHVWCEKPMAMTVSECEEIIHACNKNKVQLTIGYRMHHEPNTQTLMKFASSQPYGKMKSVISEAGYKGGGGPQDNWRMNQNQGGGALYDMGVYPINAARYATGLEPIAVTARHEIHRPQIFKNADETSIFTLEFKGGLKAECATSVGKNMNLLQVDCEKGWYKLEPMQSYTSVRGVTSDGSKALDQVSPYFNQQAVQMDNDALAILNPKKNKILVPGEEGLLDIRVVEGALESVKKGSKRVELA